MAVKLLSISTWSRHAPRRAERKEYMEEYVAEDVAREQMANDPALASGFRKKVEIDEALAKNLHARLKFFARRHASWDERFNLYPVVRTNAAS